MIDRLAQAGVRHAHIRHTIFFELNELKEKMHSAEVSCSLLSCKQNVSGRKESTELFSKEKSIIRLSNKNTGRRNQRDLIVSSARLTVRPK